MFINSLSLFKPRIKTGKKIVRDVAISFLRDERVVVDGFQTLLTFLNHVEALRFSIARVVLAPLGTFLCLDGRVERGGFFLLDLIRVVEGGRRRRAELDQRFVQCFVLPRFGPGGNVLDVDQLVNVVVVARVRISALVVTKNLLQHWNVPVVDATRLAVGLETHWDLAKKRKKM